MGGGPVNSTVVGRDRCIATNSVQPNRVIRDRTEPSEPKHGEAGGIEASQPVHASCNWLMEGPCEGMQGKEGVQVHTLLPGD